MTHSDNAYKNRLEVMLCEHNSANSRAKESTATVDLDQSRVGRLSRMDALQHQAISATAVNHRNQQICDIKSALRRINEGMYGICGACDEAINPLRLEHNPAVRLCIQCAQDAEQS